MILFRCDSSFEIGTGHVLRCLNFAKLILAESPAQKIEFFCKDLPGNISSRLAQAGFKVHFELPDLSACRWIVIDHYGVDEVWEKALPKNVKVFVIDDLANRPHHCHVLLDQNYHSQNLKYKHLVPAQCRLLLGPQNTLLNPDLKRASSAKKISALPNILCFFGGSDENGVLLKVAESLAQKPGNFQYTLVATSSHKHLDQLKTLSLPSSVKLQIDPAHWIQLMSSSDFYFGSGGTVTWERMFLGLPGAVLSVAQNQESVAKDLAKDGYQIYWGPSGQFDYSQVSEKLESLMSNAGAVEKMSASGLKLVDRFSSQLIREIFT